MDLSCVKYVNQESLKSDNGPLGIKLFPFQKDIKNPLIYLEWLNGGITIGLMITKE